MFTLEGRVTNSSGEPIPGVKVIMFSEDRSLIVHETLTNEKGKYDRFEVAMGDVYVFEIS